MSGERNSQPSDSNRGTECDISRRDVLRQAGVGTVGTVALSGIGAADDTLDCSDAEDPSDGCEGPSAPVGFPYLHDSDGDGTDERYGSWPSSPDELAFFVHGFKSSSTQNGINQAHAAELAADHNGYTEPFVAVCYDTDASWSTAKSNAEDEGQRLGQFLVEYMADNPETTIRLLGHSLGTRVVVYCLQELASSGASVDAAAAVGGAIDADSVTTKNGYDQSQFDEAIENAAERFDNYHNTDDSILDGSYYWSEWEEAVGEIGCDGPAPSNYTDHDVTNQVCNHCTYFKTNEGCMNAVVGNW